MGAIVVGMPPSQDLCCSWACPQRKTLQRRSHSTKLSKCAWFSKHTLADCHAPKDSNKLKWNSC